MLAALFVLESYRNGVLEFALAVQAAIAEWVVPNDIWLCHNVSLMIIHDAAPCSMIQAHGELGPAAVSCTKARKSLGLVPDKGFEAKGTITPQPGTSCAGSEGMTSTSVQRAPAPSIHLPYRGAVMYDGHMLSAYHACKLVCIPAKKKAVPGCVLRSEDLRERERESARWRNGDGGAEGKRARLSG